MSSLNNLSNTTRSIIIGMLLLGLVIGYLVGSNRVPSDAGPEHLSETYLDIYMTGLASNFAQTGDVNLVKHGLCFGDAKEAAEQRLTSGTIENDNMLSAYQQVLPIVRGDADQICEAYRTEVLGEGAAGGGGMVRTILTTLLAVLLLAALIGGLAWYFITQRETDSTRTEAAPEPRDDRNWDRILRREETTEKTQVTSTEDFRSAAAAPALSKPTPAVDPSMPQPIGGFSTTYNRGDDAFDKSFIIENSNGDFLGECGVSISEYVNTDDGARNVTAFEIWLFDKNDTHTVTKVIMSDHAFGDEATRAKLAVRGESVLASLNETVALETNALIINANVNDLVYANTNPARGVFDRFTIDLSAWVKSQMEQASGSASDMLNF